MTINDERDRILAEIAKSAIAIPTLDERGNDSLDFHEVAVWTLKEAMRLAYAAGHRAPAAATEACAALDAYARDLYEEIPEDLAAIVAQAREAIGMNKVPPAGVCPRCGEADQDELVWDGAGETVTCQRCGTNYTVHRIN